MRKRSFILASTVALFSLVALTAYNPAPAGPSANGQGGLMIGDRLQQFSFHANTANDGSVSGSFEIKSPSQDLRLHGTISCLSVLPDGKTAFLSGVITQRVGDGFPGDYNVGDHVYFEVQDNGEGNAADADRFSDLYTSGATEFCGPYSIGTQAIVNGNIQVKP